LGIFKEDVFSILVGGQWFDVIDRSFDVGDFDVCYLADDEMTERAARLADTDPLVSALSFTAKVKGGAGHPDAGTDEYISGPLAHLQAVRHY
jgi:hypothetical protein